MRTYEIRERVEKYKHIIDYNCDICKKDNPNKDEDWSPLNNYYDSDDIEISRKKYSHYPDSGRDYGINQVIHMCPDCWVDKFLPWLETFGGKPTDLGQDYY